MPDLNTASGAPIAPHRIAMHMSRLGITWEQLHTDPHLHGTNRMLRSLLTLMEMALHDEDVDPAVADRVIDRVIYGAVPTEADVHARIKQHRHSVDLLRTAALPPMPFPIEEYRSGG